MNPSSTTKQERRLKKSFAILGPASLLALALTQVGFGRAGRLNTMSALDIPVPPVVSRSTKMGHTNPGRVLHLSICMPFADLEGIKEFNDRVCDPKSPDYGKFITPEVVGERFGLSYGTVQSIANYLRSQGFKIDLVAKNRLNILADCTAAQAERAFGITIDDFHAKDPKEKGHLDFFSFTSSPKVPSELAPYIIEIEGLSSFNKPVPMAALTPSQTHVLYNTAPMVTAGMNGQGRTLAISNWDCYKLSNVPLYYSHFSLPTPAGGVGSNVHEVMMGGFTNTGAVQGEADLDIQMVLGMAPLSEFYIYSSGSADGGGTILTNVLTREANDNLVDIVSESWGWSMSSGLASAAHNLHLSMTAQGITYMAASGDHGTDQSTYYPTIDGEVLMVGGTVASTDSLGNRTNEVAWSLSGGWGGGGGWSTNSYAFNVRPSWQTGDGVLTSVNKRLSPDVSAHAANGPYQWYLNGALQNGGWVGTSFACPMFCGSLALAEQKFIALGGLPANGAGKRRFGRIQDLIYSQNGRADVWHDITVGNNGNLPDNTPSNCTPKWDTVTGWGAIDFDAFISSLTNPAPLLSSISPDNKPAGSGAFTLTCTGTGFVNGSVIRWNGADLTTSFVNSTTLTANVPAGNVGAAGTASILVHSPTPGGGDSGTKTFTITATTMTLDIGSASPGSGITITVWKTDINGHANGVTPFNRVYNTGDTASLTAPASVNGGATVFDRWEKDGVSQGGLRTISVQMGAPHAVTAVYTPAYVLTINSSNPNSGVGVTVYQADINGLKNGTTSFTRTYKSGTSVSLTAPGTAGGNRFIRWEKDGISVGASMTITVGMNAAHTMTAVYSPVNTLTIDSQNPNSGVPITVWTTAVGGLLNGTTSFTRDYVPGTVASVSAPATASGNYFKNWLKDGVAQGTSRTVSTTMNSDHTVTAVYAPGATLAVNSSGVSGVSITVYQADVTGLTNGVTNFSRVYFLNTNVGLTAPATAGGKTFSNWTKDGVSQGSAKTITVAMGASHTVVAVYN